MKKIIVSSGYMGSGSSAVTDLLAEYRGTENSFRSFEYVFLHCPQGLFDLEDKLIIGNNALRSDEAIRTFRKEMKKLYDKKYYWVGDYKTKIGKNFMMETDKFLDEITEFNIDSYWYIHEEVNLKMFLMLLVRKIVKFITFNKVILNRPMKYNDGVKISFTTKEKFYAAAKKYIYNVLENISRGNENIMLDQLLLPFNLHRVDNYFGDELKVIVVERDPRDVFITNKYIWPKRNLSVPFPTDALEFSKFYKSMRKSEIPSSSKKVLRIKFEDLIYNYDDTVNNIEKFMNYKKQDHIDKFKRFNPNVSIKNTQLFYDDKYQEEVKIITRELRDYLYEFPYKLNNNVKDTVEFE